jgi:type IV pilus assembly protein PilV
MIEVLVTVLILAIGLLGLAGMQANGLRTNHSAYLRSQATILGYDIADRIRANRTAALAGQYTVGLENTGSGSGMAAQDVVAWKANLQSMLPSGKGSVSLANGNRFTITVQWDDDRAEGQDTAPKQFVLRTDL